MKRIVDWLAKPVHWERTVHVTFEVTGRRWEWVYAGAVVVGVTVAILVLR